MKEKKTVQGIYEAAEVYHYAFGFRDTARDAGLLISTSDRFGNGGRCFLEIACGDCPYAIDLMEAGVVYHGLDLSNEMLTFAAERLETAGCEVNGHLHLANMREFSLAQKFDLVFVLMGSLHYLNNEEFLQHLDLVWEHLNPEGLYVLEWCVDYTPSVEQNDEWTEDSPLGHIRIIYCSTQKSILEQKFEEQIDFEVDGELIASTKDLIHMRYIKEFELLLQAQERRWDIIGHFNRWDLDQPGVEAGDVNRPLCILKKRVR